MTFARWMVLLAACLWLAGCGGSDPHDSEAGVTTDASMLSDGGPSPDSGPDAGPLADTDLTAVWAQTGQRKVPREDLWATADPNVVHNSVWDGETISVFGARNEVVAFALVLEAGDQDVADIRVSFDRLTGPGGRTIASAPATGDGIFEWTDRPIELFYVRYLQIRGLSALSYEHYDERHIPERFRRPFTGEGDGTGGWTDRPDHDKHYPDIAVPLELEPTFTVASGESQMVWVDVYLPTTASAGLYRGTVEITEGGEATHRIPVELTVRDFALPDAPTLGTQVYYSYENVNERYLGEAWPWEPADVAASRQIRDRHFQMAHRHKISLIDADEGSDAWTADRPRPEWEPRLDGSLFTEAQGYDGPGVGVGNGIYVIGVYGGWSWQGHGQSAMRSHSDGWVQWFTANAPDTEYFLYLIDESSDYAQIEQWAGWIENNPGPGSELMSMATIAAPAATASTPSLDIAASWMTVGLPTEWEPAVDALRLDPDKRIYFYNGNRPATGSFATEDDGVALRVLAWTQYKHGIDRWFFWEATYYDNYQAGEGATDVFETAATFGGRDGDDAELGEWGWNHSNGDGVLFYPGTDHVFSARSYGVNGPLASLRLKLWRRGLQDGDYLALAAARDPTRVAEIVAELLPTSMWEYGVSDPGDPTWVRADISWSTDPDVWEAARTELADIIEAP